MSFKEWPENFQAPLEVSLAMYFHSYVRMVTSYIIRSKLLNFTKTSELHDPSVSTVKC